jgi:hypothetical protein
VVVDLQVAHCYHSHRHIDAMGVGDVGYDSRRDDSAVVVDQHCETMVVVVVRIDRRSGHRDDISDHNPLVHHHSWVVVHGEDRTEAPRHAMVEGHNRWYRHHHH